MKRRLFLLLLLITLAMTGTANAVPALSNLLLNPGFEFYGPVSGGEHANLANFGGWTKGGTGILTIAAYFKISSDPPSANPEQARIQVRIGSQDGVNVGSIPDLSASWNASGDEYWSDGLLVSGSRDLQGEFALNACIDISFQPDGDSLSKSPFTHLFIENAYAGVAEDDMAPNDVPEPDMMMLLGSGLLVLAGIGRRFTRT